MLLKLTGCALIALTGFGAGCMLTKRLGARRDFFGKFCVFISLLQTRIRYDSADIFTLVSCCAEGSGLELFESADDTLPFADFWNSEIEKIPKKAGLNNSDKELLSEFGSLLGTTDVEGQLKHLELYGSIFQKRLNDSQAEFRDKSRIYRALGLFGGISAALIIL